MDDRPHYGGAHEAAGGGGRPQRGNPRRGFPLYLLLRFFEHGGIPRAAARGQGLGTRKKNTAAEMTAMAPVSIASSLSLAPAPGLPPI